MITLGNAVPDFEASSTGDKTVKLNDYQGKYLIIYFYPKDNTPGCTQEGQSFRDNIDKLTALNAAYHLSVSHNLTKCRQGQVILQTSHEAA